MRASWGRCVEIGVKRRVRPHTESHHIESHARLSIWPCTQQIWHLVVAGPFLALVVLPCGSTCAPALGRPRHCRVCAISRVALLEHPHCCSTARDANLVTGRGLCISVPHGRDSETPRAEKWPAMASFAEEIGKWRAVARCAFFLYLIPTFEAL